MTDFSIYFAERAVTDTMFGAEIITGSHAYLALTEENDIDKPRIREEVHFKNEGFLRLRHHRYYTNDHPAKPFDRTEVFKHQRGKWCDIKPIWDDAVSFARKVDTLDIPFCGFRLMESYNCRAAAISILQHMGIEYQAPKRVQSNAGTQSDLYSHIQQKMQQLQAR